MLTNSEFSEIARAKVNLTLHVGPVRADGYHPLQSLVVFAEIGDVLNLEKREGQGAATLSVSGPFASALPADRDNLVLKASLLYDKLETLDWHPHFHLEKNLPVAGGIGGGSAGAAAALRLCVASGSGFVSEFTARVLELGADIPVCLRSRTCEIRGIGEQIRLLPNKGQIPAVLANPGLPLSTAEVFRKFDQHNKSHRDWIREIGQGIDLRELIKAGRNDLQNIAIGLVPEIAEVLDVLETEPGCELARMSGSGPTCFGLFDTHNAAQKAAHSIKTGHRDWWCVPTMLRDKG